MAFLVKLLIITANHQSLHMDTLKYPIGKFRRPETIGKSQVDDYLKNIASLPQRLREAVDGLTEEQLDTPYRPEGWTVRQVVHHVADSHLNSYARFKLALTEEKPMIKPYFEDRWAELPDSKGPVGTSLDLLTALHARWISLLQSLGPEELAKVFVHPQYGKEYRLDVMMALYSWHGNHHLAHIESLKERMGW